MNQHMSEQTLFVAVRPAPLVLSLGLQGHLGGKATYTRYAPASRVQCDECVTVLHEAHGYGPLPRSAQLIRKSPAGQLRLCHEHASLWRELDKRESSHVSRAVPQKPSTTTKSTIITPTLFDQEGATA